jgi:putative hydrolase of the HAD superfamily
MGRTTKSESNHPKFFIKRGFYQRAGDRAVLDCLSPDRAIMETMPHSSPPNGRQTLLIDADDTLWENNIYFERAIANFISFLNHQEYSAAQVREVLNQVERECILSHGYGLHSFAHALAQTFTRLAVEPLTPALHETISGITAAIAEQPIEVCFGVPETLSYLAERHQLILLTKGAIAEQSGKVERSGLKQYFSAVEIVAEKDLAAYQALAAKRELAAVSTWMIGNSPKSDVNPALAAGLNAVFVPHGNTWILEHEEVAPARPHRRLLILESFAQLRNHF